MANGHGGKRTPRNPAPVSGPGRLSKRTDGQAAQYVSGLPYGEGQDFYELQQSAPMSASSSMPSARRAPVPTPAPAPTPLFAPTERPDEPVTSGASRGPGPNSLPGTGVVYPGRLTRALETAATKDTSGDVEFLLGLAQRLGL